MARTIWNWPDLRKATADAEKLPKGDLPEVGTVVVCSLEVGVAACADFDSDIWLICQSNVYCLSGTRDWRYATTSEIDQFERDSALPDIVDPIEAEIAAIYFDWHSGRTLGVERTIRTAINRGIEIERARKAGA